MFKAQISLILPLLAGTTPAPRLETPQAYFSPLPASAIALQTPLAAPAIVAHALVAALPAAAAPLPVGEPVQPAPGEELAAIAEESRLIFDGGRQLKAPVTSEPPSSRVVNPVLTGIVSGLAATAIPAVTAKLLRPIDAAMDLIPRDPWSSLHTTAPLWDLNLHQAQEIFGLGLLAGGTFLVASWLAPKTRRLTVAAAAAALALFLPAPIQTATLAAGEELLFRAGLLRRLREALNSRGNPHAVTWALAVSSVAFSLAHIPLHGFTLELFVLKSFIGAVFGLVYMRAGLPAAAAAHATYNFAVTAFFQ